MNKEEMYVMYCKFSFIEHINELKKNTKTNVIAYLSKVWNTYLEDEMRDTSGGWFLGEAKDIQEFLKDSSYIDMVLKKETKEYAYKDMLNKFVFLPDSGKKEEFQFLNEKELVDLMLTEIDSIYASVITSPLMYDEELYHYAIYPHIKEGGIAVLFNEKAVEIWHRIKTMKLQ